MLASRSSEQQDDTISTGRLTDADKRAIAAGAASVYELAAATAEPASYQNDDHREAVEAIYRSWNMAFAPGDARSFERRLEWDGLTPVRARLAIARSFAEDRNVMLPSWLGWLDNISEQAATLAESLTDELIQELHRGIGQDHPFIELLAPMIRAGTQAVQARLNASTLELVGAAAMRGFESQLGRELSRVAELALFDQFRAFVGDMVQHPTPPAEEHADAYSLWVASVLRSGFPGLFVTFPVLARQVATVLEGWVQATCELLTRVEADRPAIAACFNEGKPIGALVAVKPALSDPHNGRRRVAALEFETGLNLVYKPRDVGLEKAFSSFLLWMAREGSTPAQRALQVLARDGYGWVELVVPGQLRHRHEVRLHFERWGGLICLAYLFRGRDLHMENLIATSEGPVLIDLELLFEPESATGLESAGGDSGDAACLASESCLSSGLVSFIEASPDGSMFDVGALRGTGEGVTALAQRRWRNLRTAAIHFVEERVFRTATHNRVEFEGRLEDPEPWAEAILDGFEHTYRFLLEHRRRILADDGPLAAFVNLEARVIPRPTNQYGLLIYVLNQPKYQRRGVVRSAAMDALHRIFAASSTRPAAWNLVRVERLALEAMDFPLFGVRTDDTCVTADGESVLEGYFSRPGLAAVVRLFEGFSEIDLAAQREELATVLRESIRARFFTRREPAPFDADDPLNEGGAHLEYARWIADELLARGRTDGERLVWTPDRGAQQGLGDLNLYDGPIGASLFLAAMFAVTGEEKWRVASRASLAPLAAHLARPVSDWSEVSIGGASGLGSMTYAFALIGSLIEEPSCYDWARRCRRQLTAERIAADGSLDVVAGAAGTILALLSSRHVLGAETLGPLVSCGERLLNTAIRGPRGWKWRAVDGRHYVGFAHGAAGIGYALRRLGDASEDARFIDAADQAFDFVASAFSQGRANWSTTDEETKGPGPSRSMIAWCHGAAGIGLALAPEAGRSAAWRQRLSSALQITASGTDHRAEHLCCGNMGRAETLLTAGRACGMKDAVAASRHTLRRVMRRAESRGHFRLSTSPFTYRIFDPGFFRGISGIGYQFLRAAAPDRIPSVLSFDVIRRSASVAV